MTELNLKWSNKHNEIMELKFDGNITEIKHSDFLEDFVEFQIQTIFNNYVLTKDERQIISLFCSLSYIMK